MSSNLDISALAGAPKAPGTPQRMPVRGVVKIPPADVTSPTMRVIAPAYSGDYGYDCRWTRQGDALPAIDADCFVEFDETGAGIVTWFAITAAPIWSPGDLKMTAAAVPAAGWLACDGSSHLRTDFPALFAALGGASSPWGLPDGTHFSVPSSHDGFLVGAGGTHALGATGGEATHALTTGEMPAHTHKSPGQLIGTLFGSGGSPLQGWNAPTIDSSSTSTSSAGSGTAHNNLPPFVAVNVHIKT